MLGGTVRAATRSAGVEVDQHRKAASLVDALADAPAEAMVIIDLTVDGAIAAAREAVEAGRAVYATGPHVEAALLREARAAGCREVVPRSQFGERVAVWVRGGV